MTADDLDTSLPSPAFLAEMEWDILGEQHLAEMRAERAREAEEEAKRLASFQADRAGILALPDAPLLEEMQAQYTRWDVASDDVGEWAWHPRFTGPDDPGLRAWQLRAEQEYERLRFIRDEAERRGIWSRPPAPAPEDTSTVSDSITDDFFDQLGAAIPDAEHDGPGR